MRWQQWSLAALFFCAVGCGDNKAVFIDNNGEATNNANPNNTQNNGSNNANPNNTPNNITKNNDTNNSTNNGSNTSTNNATNNVIGDIYETVPAEDLRDYDGLFPARPNAPVDSFVYEMVDAFCERAIACRTDYVIAASLIELGVGTRADCMKNFFNRNPLAGYAASVADGRSQFSPAQIPACKQAIAGAQCRELGAAFASPGTVFQACESALTGQAGFDAVCFSNADCRAGLYCQHGLGDTCGGLCKVPQPPNNLCGADVVCAATQYCDLIDLQCMPSKTIDSSCVENYECGIGNWCHKQACAVIKLGYQAGQPCNNVSNLCALGLRCDVDLGDGTCAEVATAGESCVESSDCRYDTHCDGTVCQQKAAEGACTFDDDCLSATCQSDSVCMSTTLGCASM